LRSFETGETRQVQGALEVGRFQYFSVDVQPRRATVSPFSKETSFEATVMNLGNAEETVQMFASDAEGFFAYEFDADQATLAPGQQRVLSLTASASRSALVSNPRLQNFTVAARSVETPAIAASAQGQIEQKAFLSPGSVVFGFLLAMLALAWVLLWPKPPIVDGATVKPNPVIAGSPVEIVWSASNARSVTVRVGDWTQEKLPPNGSATFTPAEAGELQAEIVAFNGDQRSAVRIVAFRVDAPPVVPDPKIVRFAVDERTVRPGQSVDIRYRFNEAVTSATLFPMQQALDVKADRIVVRLDEPGQQRLWIKARNAAGKEVESDPIVVTVSEGVEASIVKFTVTPTELDAANPTVTVDWTVADAKRIEITFGTETIVTEESTGRREVTLTAETTFKLVAYDDKGRTVASEPVTVKMKAPPPTDPASGTTGGN
jgi:hypothetical protein